MDPPRLDPIIHQASRLRIMTVLYRNRQLAVTTLRDLLEMTDGNVASHLARLEEAAYVRTGRVMVDVTFEVHARITDAGGQAYRAYLGELRRLVETLDEAGP